MDRFDITFIHKMTVKNFKFCYFKNDVFAFKKESEKVGWYYSYYVKSVCSICCEPYFVKRGCKNKAHNKCKMIPFRVSETRAKEKIDCV